MNKAEQYNWAKPGDRGKQKMVPIKDILIDHSYQRQEMHDIKILRIASSFNWTSFGSLVLMERPNGNKYVVDGQQRLAAAKRRGDISNVPCIVFISDGSQHEAKAFISLNVDRTPVSAVCKFLAGVKAVKRPECDIAAWLKLEKLHVASDGRDVNGVSFPSTLVALWKAGEDSSKTAIKIQREINPTIPLHSITHKGLWWLLQVGKIKIFQHLDILQTCGGSVAIAGAVKEIEIITGLKASVRTCGLGVLKVVNSKLHKKISLPSAE